MKDKSLLLVLLFPVVFFVILIGLVWVPRLWIDPQYSFVYSFDQGCESFENDDGIIKKTNRCSGDVPVENGARIYYYDIQTKETEEITIEQANNLNLLDQEESPDDFILKKSRSETPFGSSQNNLYLQGNGGSYPVESPEEFRFFELEFLGWEQNN